MLWAYVLENMGLEDNRSNQPLFLLIKDLEIPEDNLYFDKDLHRPELFTLLEQIPDGHRLAIRSVLDLADSLSDLISVFQNLTNKQITLCSCEEPYLCGDDYLETLTDFVRLYVDFEKKKQKQSYKKAVEDGTVGRPAKTKEIEQAISMYQSGKYKVSQIEAVTGVSKSTLYRYLKHE
ncbi:MAG: hypothetical protein EOM28_03160 [Clostridia bacterium]|nr:hypothetical protein [Clostridia bacterium]